MARVTLCRERFRLTVIERRSSLVLVFVAVWGLARAPTAFLPDEDQGYLIVSAQLPDGAAKERT
ncbi:MAG: hypothetical protein WCD69_22745, partial [Xanthobacteraceae bacterium]